MRMGGAICTVLLNRAIASTGTYLPASHWVSTGVSTMAARCHMVINTDNATCARAMYTTTLEAVPPGNRTRGSVHRKFIGQPQRRGDGPAHERHDQNWAKTPRATGLGVRATRRKSSSDNVMPMPSMITARPQTISGP